MANTRTPGSLGRARTMWWRLHTTRVLVTKPASLFRNALVLWQGWDDGLLFGGYWLLDQ
ncbi:hypothetical protein MY4824_005085 [Beauveria thailandica]